LLLLIPLHSDIFHPNQRFLLHFTDRYQQILQRKRLLPLVPWGLLVRPVNGKALFALVPPDANIFIYLFILCFGFVFCFFWLKDYLIFLLFANRINICALAHSLHSLVPLAGYTSHSIGQPGGSVLLHQNHSLHSHFLASILHAGDFFSFSHFPQFAHYFGS
jgi:hypothetical protein